MELDALGAEAEWLRIVQRLACREQLVGHLPLPRGVEARPVVRAEGEHPRQEARQMLKRVARSQAVGDEMARAANLPEVGARDEQQPARVRPA